MQEKLVKKIKNITQSSGIYKFIDENDEILYIGKAKSLRNRLVSYTRTDKLSSRIARMTFLARKLEIVTTNSDLEAILLEHNLIKKHKPRFNILLKDDKKFASIAIDKKHDFGRIFKHRGKKTNDLHLFGPFASAYDTNRVIDILRKCFKIRNCSDAEFARRTKPCLEYQIKKCTAPCVDYISKTDYQKSIKKAVEFLSGKSAEIQKDLSQKMQKYSAATEYEKAAIIRDQIKSLTSIQAKQNINLSNINNADIITFVKKQNDICIYIAIYRNGNNFGARPHYYHNEKDLSAAEFFSQFLCQFYVENNPPTHIIINQEIDDQELVNKLLDKIANKKVLLETPKRGQKFTVVQDQEKIALELLQEKIAKNISDKKLLLELKEKFSLSKLPNRIEIYDNSHTFGQDAICAMVVATPEGLNKSQYRKFNIRFDQSANRDDTAMMKEALSRRFKHFKDQNSKEHQLNPDLLIIDGGLPQLSAVNEVFSKLNIDIDVICMAKGENRNAGEETYFKLDRSEVSVARKTALAYFLQRLRDEAHRFAISSHRSKRAKNISKSKLDDLENIGSKRKKILLSHFGSLEKIKQASIQDLEKVGGISKKIAKSIFDQLQR